MGTIYNLSRLYNLITLLHRGHFPVQANGSTYLWIFGEKVIGLCKLLNIIARLLNQLLRPLGIILYKQISTILYL